MIGKADSLCSGKRDDITARTHGVYFVLGHTGGNYNGGVRERTFV